MPKRKQLIELLAALRLLQKKKIPDVESGICHNLGCEFMLPWQLWKPIMLEALKHCSWYSGDEDYPIPGCGYIDAKVAYHGTINKWATETFSTRSYALRRFELVDRMIDVCIKHIDSTESKLSVISK